MTETATSARGQTTDGHGGPAHVMPVHVLLIVWGALVALTVATVAVTYVDLGDLNIWIALGIATIKATLVALYFMHLRYDSPFNAIILFCALMFVALFISITLMDTAAYQEHLQAP